MYFVEELLSLFRGRRGKNQWNILVAMRKPECDYILNETEQFKENYNTFYTLTNFYQNLDIISKLTLNVPYITEIIRNFHGNMVCVICNPNESRNFDFTRSPRVMKISLGSCLQLMSVREFEIMLVK